MHSLNSPNSYRRGSYPSYSYLPDLAVCSFRIGTEDPILVIQPKWLALILNGEKTLEIRDKPCTSKVGKQVWLCPSRTAMVTGMAIVKSSRRLSAHEWESTRKQHCVPGQRRYGDRTHAWELVGAQCIAPVAIVRKRGSVEWQTGPGC